MPVVQQQAVRARVRPRKLDRHDLDKLSDILGIVECFGRYARSRSIT
jgi:hypothetical protein